MNKSCFSLIVAVIISMLLSSCANHMRYETKSEPRIERKNIGEEFFIDKKAQSSSEELICIEVSKANNYDVTQSEHTVKKEIYTPYSGTRELYEFWGGLGMLPVALVVNAADFATLGLIPNDLTDDSLDICLTGLNPCLNWESESRKQEKELERKNRIIGRKKETNKEMAGHQKVTLSANEKILESFYTDRKGYLEIRLLDEKLMNKAIEVRELTISTGQGDNAATKKFIIGRQLMFRLKRAGKIIKDYQKKPSSELLAQTVLELEKMNFKKSSLVLEKQELQKHDAAFKKKFETKMEQLLSAE
jgi:hypothetical protein